MSDTAAPTSAPAATTPAAPAAKPAIQLTAPKPAAPVTPPAPVDGTPGAPETPAPEPKGDADLIRQMAKLASSERKAQKLVEKLQADLTAATGSATEAQTQAALLAEVKKNPRKLLEMGLTWDQVLDAMSGKEETPEDPRLTAQAAELKKLQDRIDAREKAETEAKEKAAREKYEAEVASARAGIQEDIATLGVKPDADGYPRWAIVSQDPTSAQTAMDAVIDFVTANKLKVTDTEAGELVHQALDQMEAHERKRLAPLLAAHATKSGSLDTQIQKAAPPSTKPRAPLPPDRFEAAAQRSPTPSTGPRTRARA